LTRKSPYKHDVKQHLRKGHVVHHYKRGDGKPERRVIGAKTHGARFRVNVNYIDEGEHFQPGQRYPESFGVKSEHLTVSAADYPEALAAGLNQARKGEPVTVLIRRI
jgi:hypothetical protein